MNKYWETAIVGLLGELSSTQSELLELLAEKRRLLAEADTTKLEDLQPREEQLIERLQACHHNRQELLSRAAEEGLPSDSIRTLAENLPESPRLKIQRQVSQARSQTQLLQHESLANWVLIQRTLLHLSQLIEIIATGGRLQPTYGDEASGTGALVDRAV